MKHLQHTELLLFQNTGTLNQFQNWYKQAVDMIDLCHQEVEQIDKNLNGSDITAQLRQELTSYKNKVNGRGIRTYIYQIDT